MSYILDAIKKSEAERGHGSIPSLQTVHSSSLSYKTQGRQLWPYILSTLLLLNLAGLFYYFSSVDKTENIAALTSVNTDTERAVEKQVNPAVATRDVVPVEASPPITTVNKEPEVVYAEQVTVTPVQETPVTETTSREIVSIEDLPTHIRQNIPTMSFSGHVYSSDAGQRSIIIDGDFMEQGDRLSAELTLAEITSSGAIFDYRGTLFEVSVITGWN